MLSRASGRLAIDCFGETNADLKLIRLCLGDVNGSVFARRSELAVAFRDSPRERTIIYGSSR
jgi:hypothetical protein